MVCPLSRGSCVPLSPFVPLCMDCVFAFSRVLSPFVSPRSPLHGLCVRLLQDLLSLCLPLCPFIWMACPPSPRSCLPLSSFVSLHMGGAHAFSRVLSPFVSPCISGVSAFASVLSPLVSPCTLLMDVVSAFSKVLSPFVSPCTPSYGWCDRLCFPLAPLRTAGVVGAAAGV